MALWPASSNLRDTIRVFVYSFEYSLSDLLRCHRERAEIDKWYMDWCQCAKKLKFKNGSYRDGNGSSVAYTQPWTRDHRGTASIEIYLYAALMQGRLKAWGVARTLTPADADLFFVPLFPALSFMLGTKCASSCSGVRQPTCANKTHSERMRSALGQVRASPAFAARPSRHFVVGVAELTKTLFINQDAMGASLHLHTPAPFARWVANTTARMALVDVESSWGLQPLFRNVVVAPYIPVNALLGGGVYGRVEAQIAAEAGVASASSARVPLEPLKPTPTRPVLLYFRGSPYGIERAQLMRALFHTSDGMPPQPDVLLHYSDAGVRSRGDYEPKSSAITRVRFDGSYASTMRNSTFCVIPPGHTCTSRRHFDAIAAGCLPVLVRGLKRGCDARDAPKVQGTRRATADSSTAFVHLLNHSAYAVTFEWSTVQRDPASLLRTLRKIAADSAELSERRRRLLEARRVLTYAFATGGRGGASRGASTRPADDPQDAQAVESDAAAGENAAPDPFSRDTEYGGASRAIYQELLWASVTAERLGLGTVGPQPTA